MYFLEVSVAAQFSGRRYYTYESAEIVKIGDIVYVPFGKKQSLGIVRSIVKKPTFVTKSITQNTDLNVPATSLDLLSWMEHYYPYDYGDMTGLFIPPNARTQSRKIEQTIPTPITLPQPALTQDQQSALTLMTQNKHVLLHGDTGTGKTRVFLEFANNILSQGKSVLILTPEIGLTPQLEQSIKNSCPYPVFSTHSQKTPAYRKRVWLRAATHSEPTLFIGPRSSLFLPYNNLGLVVVDEAHDNSYKSMQNPRYHALYVAAQLAKLHQAHFVQSTATPNVSDYTFVASKNIPIARMTKIAAGEAKSHGVSVDLTNKDLFTKHRLISDVLVHAITQALENNEQVMLFINRRGSARVVQCNSCGSIASCDTCGLPLTYHHDTHMLSCHLCARNQKAQNQCMQCGSADIVYFSAGTKGIEQEIAQLFPNASIARFDLDVAAKDTIQRKLHELQTGAYDIIIGTQVISKGFDLPKLSVVGVLNADSGFTLPDYRSEEITFQQLYQVTGRVGRGHSDSNYIIQTRQPNHPVIEAALQRNWQTFYEYELSKRQLFRYPPFTHIAVANITKARQATAEKSARQLTQILESHSYIQVLGPSPSYHETAHGGYTWQVLIKSASRSALNAALLAIPTEWVIDIDPTSVL